MFIQLETNYIFRIYENIHKYAWVGNMRNITLHSV